MEILTRGVSIGSRSRFMVRSQPTLAFNHPDPPLIKEPGMIFMFINSRIFFNGSFLGGFCAIYLFTTGFSNCLGSNITKERINICPSGAVNSVLQLLKFIGCEINCLWFRNKTSVCGSLERELKTLRSSNETNTRYVNGILAYSYSHIPENTYTNMYYIYFCAISWNIAKVGGKHQLINKYLYLWINILIGLLWIVRSWIS